MAIHVKYFASLRQRMGRDQDMIDAAGLATAADVWARVSGSDSLPGNVRIAVNLEYAKPERQIADGDEVAFFPPVTGG